MTEPSPKRYHFGSEHRLHGQREFSAVYDARVRKNLGPISVYGKPNEAGHPRLGLSVSRRVGSAVTRNRVKRLLREAFRLTQHDFPQGYDVIVVVHPHPTARLAEYQRLLFAGLRSLHMEWQRRERRDEGSPPPPPPEAKPGPGSET